MLRLLGAAIEGVGDASPHPDPAQVFEDVVDGAPDMQHHRQSELARQFKLSGKVDALALAIGPVDEMIETDLAHRDDSAKFEAMSQQLQIPRLGAINVERMDPIRGSAAGEALRDRRSTVEACRLHRRHENSLDSRRTGALHDGIAVSVEFRCIQMTVGVDEHRSSPDRCDARALVFHRPFHSGLRFATKESMPSAASSVIMLQAMTSPAIWYAASSPISSCL